ncbi:MAG: ATP synthase F1 subunit gamma [Chlorobi bacterium]|nr:ATP synthase F1 subunit gamma [Chlorobiota bacterium]MCI0715090.1 ATP synthase F1 subunit gamma [Chlorobiota bacterium]
MATLREIKRRIGSIKSTEKITRAMKMVASVKFRKAQQNVVAARPYARKIDEILRNLIPGIEDLDNKLLKEREIKKLIAVVVSSDRGLCGSFNTNLLKSASNKIVNKYSDFYTSHNITLFTVGRKSFDYFSKRGFDIFARAVNVFDRLNFIDAQNIVKEIIKGYTENKFDKVIVIYNEFKSVVQSKIVEEQFLPIPPFVNEGEKLKTSNYIFEPSGKDIIDNLLPRHLNTQIWRVLLESYASEQAARMTAMDTATTNANDLVKQLSLTYNRARQAAITKELLEVVAGAEALRESA